MAYEKERHKVKRKERVYKYASKKEMKPIIERINEQFSFSCPFLERHTFIIHSDKVWITTQECASLDYSNLRLEAIGFVFARITKKDIKITTNTAQMFGKYARKNVVELNEEETDKVIRGLDIEWNNDKKKGVEEGYVIFRSHKGDYLGVGMYKQGRIKNMIPKARRIKRF